MTSLSTRNASVLWIMLLTIAATLTSFALACAAPFQALAALAALHMRRRDGIILMAITWGVNQAIGFGFLHYPHDPKTLVWGIGIGSAAIGSLLAARAATKLSGVTSTVGQLAVAYLAAFVALKAILVLWSLVLGGLATALSPKYAADQFVLDATILVGLYALYRGLVALGLPRAAPVALAA